MRSETKVCFENLLRRLAQSYGVASASNMFTASVPLSIKLINAVMASTDFTNRISSIPVVDIKGDVITLSISGPIAGRTNTGTTDRSPARKHALDSRTYECKKTDYDYALDYGTLDAYARFSDFDKRVLGMIYRRIALDLLTIGWYGESAAENTNKTTNPLLQDVNLGWIYDLKTNKAANYVQEASTGAKVKFGKGGDFKNLDHAAFELLSLIPQEHRTGNEVVLVGREIVAWEAAKMFETHGGTPSEKANFVVMSKSYGGMSAMTPAAFPDKGILVTDPANLQYYFQDSSIRRAIQDNPKRDQIEHYESVNDCFRVGDLDAIAGINHNHVQLLDSDEVIPGSSADNPIYTQTVAATEQAGS